MNRITIFCRKECLRKDGTAPLYANISGKNSRIRFPIAISVKLSEWNPDKQTVNGKDQRAYDLNLLIENARARITDILIRARLSNETLTKEKVMQRFNCMEEETSKPDEESSFIDFANDYLREIDRSISMGTWLRRKGIIAKIKDYDPDVRLKEITPEWLRKYAAYCRDIRGNGPGTVKKNMDTIRLFYRVAIRRRLVNDDPFDYYKAPTHYPVITFLTETELRKLVKMRGAAYLNDLQELTLDMFLFMGFTGMHYSDAGNLRIENIRDGEINYRRQKTGTPVKVPVSKPAAIIINKYRQDRYKGKLFIDYPCNQVMNRVIKEICCIAKIHKSVSVITARHTFATLYYKKNKGDIGTLSRLLGHTSVKNTMIYAHIMKDDRQKGISVFDSMM